MIGIVRGAVSNAARGAIQRRCLTTSRIVNKSEVHPGYKSIRPKQEKFGVDDGTPVFVKGGPIDSVMYGITMAACVGAVGYDCYLYYILSLK